jgi:hypothetical protein
MQEVFDGFAASGSKMWHLKKGLDDAVLAAESGCAFYELILDFLLCDRVVPDWVLDRSKRSSMRFLLWFNRCEPWRVDFHIRFGESFGTDSRNVFSVWTRERGSNFL